MDDNVLELDKNDEAHNSKENLTLHPSPQIPTVIFRNKEGTDWDYDTYGHGS
jgi:hypothetical protein